LGKPREHVSEVGRPAEAGSSGDPPGEGGRADGGREEESSLRAREEPFEPHGEKEGRPDRPKQRREGEREGEDEVPGPEAVRPSGPILLHGEKVEDEEDGPDIGNLAQDLRRMKEGVRTRRDEQERSGRRGRSTASSGEKKERDERAQSDSEKDQLRHDHVVGREQGRRHQKQRKPGRPEGLGRPGRMIELDVSLERRERPSLE